jgi:hypothetical protein
VDEDGDVEDEEPNRRIPEEDDVPEEQRLPDDDRREANRTNPYDPICVEPTIRRRSRRLRAESLVLCDPTISEVRSRT